MDREKGCIKKFSAFRIILANIQQHEKIIEPYLKDFKFTKIYGKQFDGEFYGYPFTGGFLNLDWDKIYFAFTTADQSGTYFHSGYMEGNKVFGLSLNENRKFVLTWKGEKKK